jgi:hypothetical protein
VSDYPEIAARFAGDTARHEMTVLHDDGLYRHLRFRQPRTNEFWFDLITWPGSLTIRGDYGEAYTFSRELDMLPFFRSRRGGINPHYWLQKVDSGREAAKEYSEKLFRQIVCELFVDAVRFSDAPRGIGKEVRAEILDQDLSDEGEARKLLESFEFKGFDFGETWEFSFRDYDWSFLWACHAIVWGIARYDKVARHGLRSLAATPDGDFSPEKIRFERPAPKAPRSTESITAFAEKLRSRPGEWALFGALETASYARQRAYEIRRALQGGSTRYFGPAGAFEAESRTMLGQHRVYVRYVGAAKAGDLS